MAILGPIELEIVNVDGGAIIYIILDSVSVTSTSTSGNALVVGGGHTLPVNVLIPIIFTASTLSAAVTTSTVVYYAKATSANNINVYSDAAGTTQVNFTSGTGTFFTAPSSTYFSVVLPATPCSIVLPWQSNTASIAYQTSGTPKLAATLRGY